MAPRPPGLSLAGEQHPGHPAALLQRVACARHPRAAPGLISPGGRRVLPVPDRNKAVRSFQIVIRGYDRRQVDELLARTGGTLGCGPAVLTPVTAADVRAARFAKTVRGYAPGEVDDALNAAAAEPGRRSA